MSDEIPAAEPLAAVTDEAWDAPEGMKHSDFAIGKTFFCGGRKWRCTDVGTRVITAICLDANDQINIPAATPGPSAIARRLQHHSNKAWDLFAGPPYKVAEIVFDEYDFGGCNPDPEGLSG
jgi:hypothetical protein